MSSIKFTKKEEAWLKRFKNTMTAAPKSLESKLSSYTIGDNDITIYDKVKYKEYFEEYSIDDQFDKRDQGTLVSDSDSELMWVRFPFDVESTAG